MKPQSYRALIKKARKAGFAFRRNTGGTHEIWWNESKRRTCVIPHHHEIKSGTLKSGLLSVIREIDSLLRRIGILHLHIKIYQAIMDSNLGSINELITLHHSQDPHNVS